MKTNDFWAKMTKAAFAFATVVMMGMAFTACSGSDDDDNGGGGGGVPANTIVLDGVAMPITDAVINKSYLNQGNYDIDLYTSEDRNKWVKIQAGKAPHDGKTIDLTKKEPEHGGWYWHVSCKNPGKIFETFASPVNPSPVLLSGTLYVKHLGNEGGKPVFEIVLKNGKVKDEKNGDGKEHTVNINWKGSLKLE